MGSLESSQPRRFLTAVVFTGLLLLSTAGCKSRPLGPYVSPRITGQVLAADTREPIAGASVSRGVKEHRRGSSPHGAELLMRKPPARTDANGRFELASERVLSIVRGSGWDVVPLSFERAGYRSFQTNCPTVAVTNTAGGEPVLDIGRIFLQPTAKAEQLRSSSNNP